MQKKIGKIRSLVNEVKDFHPFLKTLLPALPQVSRVEYRHGSNEFGADFVLARKDDIFGGDEYVGIVAKTGDIRQNLDEIERQIIECGIPRNFDGGKKKIVLSEIWVVSNGSISNNAQEKINHSFADKKVKFVWDERLVQLVDVHMPIYWQDVDANIGFYLGDVERNVNELNLRGGVLDGSVSDFYVEQDLIRVEFDKKIKFSIRSKNKSEKIDGVLSKERFIFIEAGMGYGKSRLLRQAAKNLASRERFVERKELPVFMSFRDLCEKYSFSLASISSDLMSRNVDLSDLDVVFMIDGVDELKVDSSEKVSGIERFVSELMPHSRMKAVFASRQFEDPVLESRLDKCCARYSLQQLTIQRIVSFIDKICANYSISSRLKEDLHKSVLFRSLPRTPISAILLAKVLSADVAELPSTLPELYAKYLDLAMGRWDVKKGMATEKEYETLSILSRILAKTVLDNDLHDMSFDEARVVIDGYLARRETGQDGALMFSKLIQMSEFFSVDRSTSRLYFRHRSFCEFMYADDLFVKHGKSAELSDPFNPYWGAVTYFYLGRLKDCPDQLRKLFSLIPRNNAEAISRLFQSGNMLLAAYHSPYVDIAECVKLAILDAADIYCSVCDNPEKHEFGWLPEVSLLAVVTGLVRNSFEYDFFSKALVDAETEILLSVDSERRKAVAAFLVASVRAGLGCKDAFVSLIDDHLSSLPLVIKLGIGHAAGDASLVNDSIRRLGKKMEKNKKNNPGYLLGLEKMYEVPVFERKKEELLH